MLILTGSGRDAREYERSAAGLYVQRQTLRDTRRLTWAQAGAVNDFAEQMEQLEQYSLGKRRNHRTADLDLDGRLVDFLTARKGGREDQSKWRELARRCDARMEAGFVNTVAWHKASASLFNTYTTAKRVIRDEAQWASAPNYFIPGRTLRARIFGGLSNIVTTPGLCNFQLRAGTVATPIAAFDSGNFQLNATAHTTLPFFADIIICAQVEGLTTTAKWIGICDVSGIMFTRTAGQTDDTQGVQELIGPATAPAQGTGYDSTISNIIDLAVGFTISGAGNGIQIHKYSLEVLT